MNARWSFLLALLTMSACSASPEFHYYTLSAESAPTSNATTPTRVGRATYVVDTVIVPSLLDKPQIVLRSSANAVEVLEDDRWAAPLPDQLQRVLAADLAVRLGADAIIAPGMPIDLHTDRRIAVSILEFDPRRSGENVIAASWTVSDGKSMTTGGGSKIYRARHVASSNGSNITEIVATMSGLVTMVADDIAATLAANEGNLPLASQ
jgi:uncharacterized protein